VLLPAVRSAAIRPHRRTRTMKHASPNILGDLGKLNQNHAAEIRRVAGSDVSSTTPRGANRPAGAIDMSRKVIAETRIVNRPSPIAPSTSRAKAPPADWAVTRVTFSSGKAKGT